MKRDALHQKYTTVYIFFIYVYVYVCVNVQSVCRYLQRLEESVPRGVIGSCEPLVSPKKISNPWYIWKWESLRCKAVSSEEVILDLVPSSSETAVLKGGRCTERRNPCEQRHRLQLCNCPSRNSKVSSKYQELRESHEQTLPLKS